MSSSEVIDWRCVQFRQSFCLFVSFDKNIVSGVVMWCSVFGHVLQYLWWCVAVFRSSRERAEGGLGARSQLCAAQYQAGQFVRVVLCYCLLFIHAQ